MSSTRYPEEFKIEAVKQGTERGHPVAEVAGRIGVSQHSLHAWIKQYTQPAETWQEQQSQSAEIRRLKAELKRVTKERDIPKKGRGVFCQVVPVRYAFIKSQEAQHPVRRLCQMVKFHPSGYYAWRTEPLSERGKANQRLAGLIKRERIRRKIYADG